MKKLCATVMALVMLFVLTGHADAAELGQVNLKNKSTINAMKKGTMNFKEVKLGDSLSAAKKKWGKDYEGVASTYQHYDYTLTYGLYLENEYEEYDDSFVGYFSGKRGKKTSEYQLQYVEYYGTSTVLKYKDMLKYWGEPDFHYVSADEEFFFYGQTALIYDDSDGQYLGYKYVNKSSVKAMKKAFLK